MAPPDWVGYLEPVRWFLELETTQAQAINPEIQLEINQGIRPVMERMAARLYWETILVRQHCRHHLLMPLQTDRAPCHHLHPMPLPQATWSDLEKLLIK